jgi:hypothetical protein
MALPRPLLRLIDPAGAYWERVSPRPRGPLHSRAAVFGPGLPEGGRQATEEEIRAMDAEAVAATRRYEADVEDVERRYSDELRRVAERLLVDGAAIFRLEGRSVEARVVRFWRGDALLETSTTGPDGEGSSRTRIPRRPDPELLVGYLARAAAKD